MLQSMQRSKFVGPNYGVGDAAHPPVAAVLFLLPVVSVHSLQDGGAIRMLPTVTEGCARFGRRFFPSFFPTDMYLRVYLHPVLGRRVLFFSTYLYIPRHIYIYHVSRLTYVRPVKKRRSKGGCYYM